MKFLLKIIRLLLLALWFPLPGMLAIPGLFMGRKGIRRNARITRLWAAGCAKIIGIRTSVHGDPGGFPGGMIVSNHLGYLDILTEASIFPIRFAAKAEIRSWFLLGAYIGMSRPIWIDRSSRAKSAHVAREIERSLEENISLLVYPEGTSTAGDDGLLPFKSTPFEAICRVGKPFLPVLVKYAPTADRHPLAWYGSMTMLPHVWHVLGQPVIEAEVHILAPITPHPGEDRKQLADRTRQIMDEQYRRLS